MMVMFKMDPRSLLAVIIFIAAVRHGQTALLQTCTDDSGCTGGDAHAVCSTNTSNGGDAGGNCICTGSFKNANDACVAKALLQTCTDASDCNGGVTHAACSTNTSNGGDADGNCICTGHFKEDNDACVAKGLTDPCSADSDCSGVPNVECASATCRCSNGYKANSATCSLVHGTACTKSGICEGLAHSACLQSKCACAPGYVANNNICSPVHGTACTKTGICEGLAHSVCLQSKCACAPGYVKSNNICSPKSGAVSMKSAVGLVFGSMIVLLIQAL